MGKNVDVEITQQNVSTALGQRNFTASIQIDLLVTIRYLFVTDNVICINYLS